MFRHHLIWIRFLLFSFRLQPNLTNIHNEDVSHRDDDNSDRSITFTETSQRWTVTCHQIHNIFYTLPNAVGLSTQCVRGVVTIINSTVQQIGRTHVASARINDSSVIRWSIVRMWTEFGTGSIGMAISATPYTAYCFLFDAQQQRQCQRFHLFEWKCESPFWQQCLNRLFYSNNCIVYRSQGHSNISTEDGVSKLRVYVSQQSVGEYQCVAWFGTAALASVPAKLLLADISLDGARGSVGGGITVSSTLDMNRRSQPAQVSHWKVSPNNSIVIHCGEVASNPAPVWSFYK